MVDGRVLMSTIIFLISDVIALRERRREETGRFGGKVRALFTHGLANRAYCDKTTRASFTSLLTEDVPGREKPSVHRSW